MNCALLVVWVGASIKLISALRRPSTPSWGTFVTSHISSAALQIWETLSLLKCFCPADCGHLLYCSWEERKSRKLQSFFFPVNFWEVSDEYYEKNKESLDTVWVCYSSHCRCSVPSPVSLLSALYSGIEQHVWHHVSELRMQGTWT